MDDGQRRTQRCTGETGAVLAEAALITPLFFFLLFGILEFGGLFRDYLTMNNAAASATRQAAIAGQSGNADYWTLNAIKKASSAMPTSQITRIVIYHAVDATTPVPSGCRNGTPSSGTGSPGYAGACNIYSGADLNRPSSDFGCVNPVTGATLIDNYWCPKVRKTAVKGTGGPPDWLGVYIQVLHPWVTGLFGSNVTISTTSVVKLEADRLVQ